MKAFTELPLDELLVSCKKMTPFISFVHAYKANDGKPCKQCGEKADCPARFKYFDTAGPTVKELARRDGISIAEVRRRKAAGVYD